MYNILLITTDSQRCDTLGCMGSTFAISPNLDRLAREGVMFENAHTSSPACMPARSSLLTGVHAPIHGCIENGISRRDNMTTFPDLLKEKGYTNIMVGKTHFGPVPDSFDVCRLIKGEKKSDADDFYAEHIRAHGYSRVSSHPNNIPEELFMDAFLVDTTINEIDAVLNKNDGPFFAFCSLLSPHAPLDPPGRWGKLYEDIELPPINYREGEEDEFPLQMKKLLGLCENKPRTGKDEIDKERRLYYGLSAYCDAQIGRLIDYLDRRGIRNNTLVIFTSDHGQQMWDHGFNDKHNYYDSSWRVPLIMSLPGVIPKNEKRNFAIWNDITATILGAAGIRSECIQGFDLFTPLAEGKESPRRCAVGTIYKSAAVKTDRWKLEYYFDEGQGRLFDIINDPKEQVNLYMNPQYETIRNDLVQALLRWRADITEVEFLKKGCRGTGPVARRVNAHIASMRGIESEVRLNNAVERIG